jgi:hypothetical protein
MEIALSYAWGAQSPPLPSLVESLSELSRNLLCVTAAEVRAVDEGLIAPLMAALPVAGGGASLRAAARVLGLLGAEGGEEGEGRGEEGSSIPEVAAPEGGQNA